MKLLTIPCLALLIATACTTAPARGEIPRIELSQVTLQAVLDRVQLKFSIA